MNSISMFGIGLPTQDPRHRESGSCLGRHRIWKHEGRRRFGKTRTGVHILEYFAFLGKVPIRYELTQTECLHVLVAMCKTGFKLDKAQEAKTSRRHASA